MADREPEIIAKIVGGVAGINPRAWDRLAGDDPFVSHAFLSALEESGSVGTETGWIPAQIIVEDDASHMVAAAPAYLKTHSQGEYVFDHGWADAWQRAGGDYYPKLQIAVPFTPVPGPRLLGSRPQQLLAAAEAVTVQNDMSSAHITFIDEAGAAETERRGWLIRHGIQYHWSNRGYASFDDFLGALSSRRRKTLRKERAAARDLMLPLRTRLHAFQSVVDRPFDRLIVAELEMQERRFVDRAPIASVERVRANEVERSGDRP